MSTTRRALWLCAIGLLALAGATPALADAAQPTPQQLWEDFNHYVRIARPELARDAWLALAAQVDDEQLLDIVEASPTYQDREALMRFVRKNETLTEVGKQLEQMLTTALTKRARDRDRILDAVDRLDDGARANQNASEFLRAAGQFAVPHMLNVLLDDERQALHPYVLRGFVAVGRDAVYPLSVALSELEPLPKGQIAQVLAEIGYPSALPYLKRVAEDESIPATARARVQTAFELLAERSQIPAESSAAELFMRFAQSLYIAGSQGRAVEGYDEQNSNGQIWTYRDGAGLIGITVPGPIHSDVRTMRAARQALELDGSLDAALALHLGANARRELRLPEGERDRSYTLPHGADFYLRLAGALRQHDVLNRALEDNDIELARFAIAALDDTGGIEALVNADGRIQPLLIAMSHPNRRVRIESVFAIANARPVAEFPGSDRVVPVLAEAVRQTGAKYALAVSRDADTLNGLAAMLNEQGYTVYRHPTLATAYGDIASAPGIDVIVIDGSAPQVVELFDRTVEDYKLASTPVVARVGIDDALALKKRYLDVERLITVNRAAGREAMVTGVRQGERYGDLGSISADDAADYAVRSLELLRDIAVSGNEVFDVTRAQPTLTEALADRRPPVAIGASRVLSLINNVAAQQALASGATADGVDGQTRIGILGSLAESANYFGNQLDDQQMQAVKQLVDQSRGDVAVAAARALGALLPQTSDLVDLLVK